MIGIYFYPFLSSIIFSIALGLAGIHVVARGKEVQLLCVSQGMTLGIVLALASITTHSLLEFTGIVFAFLCGAAIYYLTEFLQGCVAKRSKTVLLLSLFTALVSVVAIASRAFPGVELHQVNQFFGDWATLSDRASYQLIAISIIAIFYFLKNLRKLGGASFFYSVMGQRQVVANTSFQAILFLLLSFAVLRVGWLYAMSCLFIPTMMAALFLHQSFLRYTFIVSLIAATGASLGFSLSLIIEWLPTIPSMVLCQLGSGLFLLGVLNVRRT